RLRPGREPARRRGSERHALARGQLHHGPGHGRLLEQRAPPRRRTHRPVGRPGPHPGDAEPVMTDVLDNDWALACIHACARVTTQHRAELYSLDRAIGDGDHGENLDRGFTAVAAKLDSASPTHLGETLKLVATTLMSTVGGAAGPL